MATASAVPNNLYDYAKQTTQSNDTAKTQVTKLSDAIANYGLGAIDYGNNINGVTARGTVDVSFQLQEVLSSARTTDQKLHDVGAAFELADRQGVKPDSLDADTVITSDAQIDSYLTDLPSIRAGAALAEFAGAHLHETQPGIDDRTFQELVAHQNDYAFINAFLASLDPITRRALLDDSSNPNIPAKYLPVVAHIVVVAFSHGMTYFTRQLAGLLYEDGTGWNLSRSPLWQALENELTKNPQAAKGFLDSFADTAMDPGELAERKYYDLEFAQPNKLGWLAKINDTTFVAIATAAMTVSRGADAETLYNRVTAVIQQSSDDYQSLSSPLEKFVGTYLAATIPPPPAHATASQLDAWAQATADFEAKKMATWHNWILNSAQHQSDNRTAAINWENFGVGVAVSIVTSVVTLNPGLGIVAGVASSAATTWSVGWVNDQLSPATGDPYSDATRFHQALSASLKAVAVADFLRNGEIVDKSGNPVSPTERNAQLVLENQQNYLITGTKDVQLDYILNGIDKMVLKNQ